jgi:hypothetical protein
MFTAPPIMVQFDLEQLTIRETDAFDHTLTTMLLQVDDKTTRLVAFLSKKLSTAKQNYIIYKKELLAIVTAFKHWAHYLQGAKHWIEVRTN